MSTLTKKIHNQIRNWQIYSVIAPAIFVSIAVILYFYFGSSFQNIFFSGVVILCVTCVAWWHWSLFTMMTMLNMLQDYDNIFNKISAQLDAIKPSLNKPKLRIIKSVDSDK